MNIKKIIKEWIIPILCTFILFIAIRNFIFFTSVIPSESMIPTLQVKDRLITSRIFSKDKLTIGDIVVFNGGVEHNFKMIKRIIGLPGDKLELKENGKIYINGDLLEEPYIKNQIHINNNEKYDGHTHAEMKLGTFQVPEGKVFLLGDNRVASIDSRYWNDPYIDMKNIIGKPLFRIWPLNRFGAIE